MIPVNFVCAVSRSLNAIFLPKKLVNAPDLSIYSLLIRKVSSFSPMQLVEVALPWVRTMDQDTSNSSMNQDEPQDPLSNADSTRSSPDENWEARQFSH